MRFSIQSIVLLLGLFVAQYSYALSCSLPSCTDRFIAAEFVFKGRPIDTGRTRDETKAEYTAKKQKASASRKLPDLYTDFEVGVAYKGHLPEKIRLYHSFSYSTPEPRNFEIYAINDNGFFIQALGPCGGCQKDNLDIEAIKSSYEEAENEIKSNPSDITRYRNKAALYEKYKDFSNAAHTYQRAAEKIEDGQLTKEDKISLGRNLYFTRQYEEALKILDAVHADATALPYWQLSLIKVGRTAELNGQKLQMRGQDLQFIELKDIDISGSDFSNAKIEYANWENVIVNNTNFSGSKLQGRFRNIQARQSNFQDSRIDIIAQILDFSNSDFSRATLRLQDAKSNFFQKSNFTAATLYMSDYSDNDFSSVNFENATIHSLGGMTTEGSNFKGASFFSAGLPGNSGDNSNLDLSGQQLDGADFSDNNLQNTSFKNASLKGAIFSEARLSKADLAGADLSNSSFAKSKYHKPADIRGVDFSKAKISNVDWTGAVYDCTTIFPSGFKVNEHQLEADDMSCVSSSQPKSYRACLKDPDASCLYRYLTEMALNKHSGSRTSSRINTMYTLAEGLISAKEFDLARAFVLRGIAESAEIYGGERAVNEDTKAVILYNKSLKDDTKKEQGGLVSVDLQKAEQAVNIAEKKLSAPERAIISSGDYALSASEILRGREALANIYLQYGLINKALEVAKSINPDNIASLYKSGYEQVKLRKEGFASKCSAFAYPIETNMGHEGLKITDLNTITGILAAYGFWGGIYGDDQSNVAEAIFEVAHYHAAHDNKEYAEHALSFLKIASQDTAEPNGATPCRRGINAHLLPAFYVLNGQYAEAKKLTDKYDDYTAGKILPYVVRSYVALGEFDKAETETKMIANTSIAIKSYKEILSAMDEAGKKEQVLQLLRRLNKASVSYQKDEIAEIKKETAKYLLKYGQKEAALKSLKESQRFSIDTTGLDCMSGSRCVAFHPHQEVLEVAARIGEGNIDPAFLPQKGDGFDVTRALAQTGYIQQALARISFDPQYCTTKATQVAIDAEAKHMDRVQKGQRSHWDRDAVFENAIRGCERELSSAARDIAFAIASSPEQEKYRQDYNRLYPIAERNAESDYSLQLPIVQFLMSGGQASQLLLAQADLRASDRPQGFIDNLIKVERYKEAEAFLNMQLHKYAALSGVSDQRKRLKEISQQFIRMGSVDRAEQVALYMLDPAGIVLKFGEQDNFNKRRDRILANTLQAMVERKIIEGRDEVVRQIKMQEYKNEVAFSVAEEALASGEKKKAHDALAHIGDTVSDAISFINSASTSSKITSNSKSFERDISIIKRKLKVMQSLDRQQDFSRYDRAVDIVYDAVRHPMFKTLMNTSAVGSKAIERLDTQARQILEQGPEVTSLDELKKIALVYHESGHTPRALEILGKAISVANRYQEYDMDRVMPLADAYAIIMGPIDQATKDTILKNLQTTPNPDLKNGNHDHVSASSDYFAVGKLVLSRAQNLLAIPE